MDRVWKVYDINHKRWLSAPLNTFDEGYDELALFSYELKDEIEIRQQEYNDNQYKYKGDDIEDLFWELSILVNTKPVLVEIITDDDFEEIKVVVDYDEINGGNDDGDDDEHDDEPRAVGSIFGGVGGMLGVALLGGLLFGGGK